MGSRHERDSEADSIPTRELISRFADATSALVKRLVSPGPFRVSATPFGAQSAERLRHASVCVRPALSRKNGFGDDTIANLHISIPRGAVHRATTSIGGGDMWRGASEAPPPGGVVLATSTAGSHHSHPTRGMVNLEDFATSIWRNPDGTCSFVTTEGGASRSPVDVHRLLQASAAEGAIHLAWPAGGAAVLPSGRVVAAGHGAEAVEEWLQGGSVPTALGSDGLNLAAGFPDGRTSHLALHRDPFVYHGAVEFLGSDIVTSTCPTSFFDLHIPPAAPPSRPATPVVRIVEAGVTLLTLHSCGTAHLSIRPDVFGAIAGNLRMDTGWEAVIPETAGIDTSVPEHIVVRAADGTHIFACRHPEGMHLHLPPESRVLLHPYSPSHPHLQSFHLVVTDGRIRPLWLPTSEELTSPKSHLRTDRGGPVHLRRGGPAQAAADAASEDAWADFTTLPILTTGEIVDEHIRRVGLDPADPTILVGLVPSRARASRGVTGLARLAAK